MFKILLLLFFLLLFTGLINRRVIRVAIIAGLILLLAREIKQHNLVSHCPGGFNWSDCSKFSHSETVEGEIVSAKGATLELDVSLGGRVVLKGWDKDVIHVSVQKRAETPEDLQNIVVKIDSDESIFGKAKTGRIQVFAKETGWFGSSAWSGKSPCVACKIMVPKKEMKNVEFNLGCCAVEVDSVKLKNISVRSGSGKLKFEDIKGDLSVNSGSGYVHASDIEGSVDVQTASGAVRLKDIDKDVRVTSGSGMIELKEIEGSVDVDASSGFVSIDEVEGAVNVHTASGAIRLSDVAGEVDASARSGNITVVRSKDAKGPVRCFTRSGHIMVKDGHGKILGQGKGQVVLK